MNLLSKDCKESKYQKTSPLKIEKHIYKLGVFILFLQLTLCSPGNQASNVLKEYHLRRILNSITIHKC